MSELYPKRYIRSSDDVGYALEQALDGRVAPDLDATIAEIDAVTGK